MRSPRMIVVLFVRMLISLGVFVAIARLVESSVSVDILIASYGAMTAVVFGLEHQQVTRFRNVVGGHLVSATIGVIVGALVAPFSRDLAIVLAVSLAVTAMVSLGVLHPPGGAVAMVAASAPHVASNKPLLFIFVVATLGAATYWAIIKVVGRAFRPLSHGVEPDL